MVQVLADSNSVYPFYEKIQSTAYSWGKYFKEGNAWKDVKIQVSLAWDFVVAHPEYSEKTLEVTTASIIIGAAYGYAQGNAFKGALIVGTLGVMYSMLSCTVDYQWENIKSYGYSYWELMAEHYIISLTSIGSFVGVIQGFQIGDSPAGKLFYASMHAALNAVGCVITGITIEVGSVIYNNPENSFEMLSTQGSSAVQNIQDGFNWIWQNMVSSYEFIVDNPVELMIVEGIVLGGMVGAVFSVCALKAGIGAVMLATTMGATTGGGIIFGVNSAYKEDINLVIKRTKSDAYKFFVEDHCKESITTVGVLTGATVIILYPEAHKAWIAIVSLGVIIYEQSGFYEDTIKAWFSGDTCNSNDGKCDEIDQ